MRLLRVGGAALAVLLVGAAAPEPAGFWTGKVKGEVPASIAGGTVLDTAALAALIARANPVLIDVSPAQRRPAGMSPDHPWLPLAHRDLPGSHWIPDVGLGVVPPALDSFYRARLRKLTAGDKARPVVLYCHPSCWLSWNAAHRAIGYGLTRVYWYPGGSEGWAEAGHPLQPATAETPG